MYKEKIVFNRVDRDNIETLETNRELECIITFDCYENAIDFSSYVNLQKSKNRTKWETCSELTDEETKTLSLYLPYSHGDMTERKEDIKKMLEDFNE